MKDHFLPLSSWRGRAATKTGTTDFHGLKFIFWRGKQSSREVESDERDRVIQKNAAIATLASAMLFLTGASVVPEFVVGHDGVIAVWLLLLINILVPIDVVFQLEKKAGP
jgi:hypothetical protein